jgi:hypothetical protein
MFYSIARNSRRTWIIATLIMLAASVTCPANSADENAQHVRLTIDYGDGVQKSFTTIPWKDKLTVFGALQAAAIHPRSIKFSYTGSGETIFITAIDDATNEGAGGSNWRYTVNEKPARYSAGIAELKPGDTVLWKFGR